MGGGERTVSRDRKKERVRNEEISAAEESVYLPKEYLKNNTQQKLK